MGMRGVYEELAALVLSVHVEWFDDYPGPPSPGALVGPWHLRLLIGNSTANDCQIWR